MKIRIVKSTRNATTNTLVGWKLPTSQAFITDKDFKALLLAKYPVNVGVVFGRYDEWAENMWGVPKGSDINTSKKAIATMGFSGAEYAAYYVTGKDKKLTKDEAVAAAKTDRIRSDHSIINNLIFKWQQNSFNISWRLWNNIGDWLG